MTSAHGGEGSPSMMAAEEPDDRSSRKFELRLNSEELFTEEFKEGDILEVLDLEGVAEDGILRGVFWVEAVELADRSGVTLRVACLGGDGKSETALLGTTFNRKKVRLHLCSGREKDAPCTVGATMAHAQTFYKYPLTDYPLKYVSEEVAKAYKRRRREWGRKRGKGGRDCSESPSRGRRGAGEENPPVRPSALRRKRKESEPPVGQEAERADPESHWRAPGGQGDEEAEEHGEPKERTSREGGHTARTRQSSNAALSHALGNLRRRLGIEKAPEQRDGVGNGGERSGDFNAAQGALGRAKTRASREPIPVEPIEDEGEATKGTTMSSLKKVQTEKKDRPPRGVLSELVNKAAKRPKEKKEERKESKSTKTAMALVQTLARGLGVKKLPKKASGEWRKRKKSRGGAEEDPEESSEGKRSKSSLTKSSESGSENTSGEDIEKVEMEKATPPLERMSQKKKGLGAEAVCAAYARIAAESRRRRDGRARVSGRRSLSHKVLALDREAPDDREDERSTGGLLPPAGTRSPAGRTSGSDGRPAGGSDHGHPSVGLGRRQLESRQAFGDKALGDDLSLEDKRGAAGSQVRQDSRPCAGHTTHALVALWQRWKSVARRGVWWRRWARKRKAQEGQRKRQGQRRSQGLAGESGAPAGKGRELKRGCVRSVLEAATDMKALGEGLAWLTVQCMDLSRGQELRTLLGLGAVKWRAESGRKHPSRSLIPIPAMQFAGLVTRLKHQSLSDFVAGLSPHLERRVDLKPDARSSLEDEERGEEAWLLCTSAGCNLMAGHRELLTAGETTALQRSAIEQLRPTLKRSLEPRQDLRWLENDCKLELRRTQVSYTGEEVEVAQRLTLPQMEPALPPFGFGGKIDILEYLSEGSASWLRSPERLKRNSDLFGGYKFEAKLHMLDTDKLSIAHTLVSRGVCDWIPISEVFEFQGKRLFNGMFGVKKEAHLDSGLPILRTIMNLTPCNRLFFPLEAGHGALPDIHSWSTIVMSGSEALETSQSDMTAAFYLFAIPRCWWGYLSFNIRCDGTELPGRTGGEHCLCCKVLPMGWHSSVSLMQEASSRIMKRANLPREHQISRNSTVPGWMVGLSGFVEPGHRDWWQLYLDNFASARLRDHYEETEANPDAWQRWHEAAEQVWGRIGIVSSEKKRVQNATQATELGAFIDGHNKMVGGSPLRLLKTAKLILFLLCSEFSVKDLQTVVGRVLFLMSFRRPSMSVFTHVWKYIAKPALRRTLLPVVRRELYNALLLLPLFKQDLTAEVADVVTCSDASQTGGATAIARELTLEGREFLRQSVQPHSTPRRERILVISLFNGIGGAFRAYDLLGIMVEGAVYSEISKEACRVTDRRWPNASNLGDIRSITRETLVTLAIRFAGCSRVDIWSGFPCVDLSAVNCYRANLQGSQSSLLFEALRVERLIRDVFPPCVKINYIYENVSSMDVEARNQISILVGGKPWKVDPRDVLPISRPRFAWVSFPPKPLEGLQFVERDGFTELQMTGQGVEAAQWIRPGWRRGGGADAGPFPCFMKAIPRRVPPPRPVGLARCDEGTRGRWHADQFKFPPYQYKEEHTLWKASRWRTLESIERELIMGFGFEHTGPCWGATAIKSDLGSYENARLSLIGDSFCTLSFAAVLACSFDWSPGEFSVDRLIRRLGMAPGVCLGWPTLAPIARRLVFGPPEGPLPDKESLVELNRVFLQRTNHTTSDVRIITGQLMNPKQALRQSIPSCLWEWRFQFQNKWGVHEHINALELRQAFNTMCWLIRDRVHFNLRWVHCSDSYVTIAILSKGRTSSLKLEALVHRFNAHLLLAQIYPVLLHVASLDNPTDEASRKFS